MLYIGGISNKEAVSRFRESMYLELAISALWIAPTSTTEEIIWGGGLLFVTCCENSN